MRAFNLKHLIIGLAMLIAAGLAFALTPREKVADHGPKVDLETMIPKQFGEWVMDESIVPLQVNPALQANLDKIYNQTLSRTYINGKSERVMLSIAYGGNQSVALQVHRPDVCYSAQGFQVGNMVKAFIRTDIGQIPAMQMVASQGKRTEPITYWITVGGTVVRGAWEQKVAKVKYGLTGKVPDGILVRVSNISSDAPDSYRLHQNFLNDMLEAMRQDDRLRLVGHFKS